MGLSSSRVSDSAGEQAEALGGLSVELQYAIQTNSNVDEKALMVRVDESGALFGVDNTRTSYAQIMKSLKGFFLLDRQDNRIFAPGEMMALVFTRRLVGGNLPHSDITLTSGESGTLMTLAMAFVIASVRANASEGRRSQLPLLRNIVFNGHFTARDRELIAGVTGGLFRLVGAADDAVTAYVDHRQAPIENEMLTAYIFGVIAARNTQIPGMHPSMGEIPAYRQRINNAVETLSKIMGVVPILPALAALAAALQD